MPALVLLGFFGMSLEQLNSVLYRNYIMITNVDYFDSNGVSAINLRYEVYQNDHASSILHILIVGLYQQIIWAAFGYEFAANCCHADRGYDLPSNCWLIQNSHKI